MPVTMSPMIFGMPKSLIYYNAVDSSLVDKLVWLLQHATFQPVFGVIFDYLFLYTSNEKRKEVGLSYVAFINWICRSIYYLSYVLKFSRNKQHYP